MDDIDIVSYIEEVYKRRKKVNSNYSLRSFARNLGVSSSVIIQILNKKKRVSPKILKTIAPKLEMPEDVFQKFLQKQIHIKKITNVTSLEKPSMKTIDVESFEVISTWYNYAILELFHLEGFDFNAQNVARVLKLPVTEAETALKNLQKVGLITLAETGNYVPTCDYTVINSVEAPSLAMKKRQKQIMEIAALKIDAVSQELRDNSSITLAVDLELLPEIKEKIKKFRRSLGNYISQNSNNASSVYELQINLIPLVLKDQHE